MDSFVTPSPMTLIWPPPLPEWATIRGRDLTESDAAFAAGVALKSLDDLIWLGFWRDRIALKSAAVAARMAGGTEDEHALRDALFLTASGDDPGLAGKLFLATRIDTTR